MSIGIGRRIKQARELRGFSREELASKIEVTPSAVSNYENNISHPKEQVLYRLLDALEVDANFLFQDSIKKLEKPITEDELSKIKMDFIDFIRTLDDEQVARVYDLVQTALRLNE